MRTFTTAALTLALAGVFSTAPAAPLTFDFEDPKGVNNVVFKLDAPLESINGTANGIRGTVTVDPDNPAEIQGRIEVDAASLMVPNPVMREHLHGADWMDVENHPLIVFELTNIADVEREGDSGTANVTGTFIMKGVSKEITVPVRVTYLPGRLADRSGGQMEGDLLVLRTDFVINRSAFGIKPGEATDKVADDIELTMAIAGAAPKP